MSSPVGWDLATIRAKVRAVTGTPSADQLSDNQINEYIQNYYVLSMPAELKEQIENQFLDFKTTPGTDVYSFPSGFFTDSPGAYADGFPLIFYQDPDVFYQDWPQQYAVDNIATGNGVTTSFSGGLQNPPIIIGTLFITDGISVFQDNGNGSFTLTYGSTTVTNVGSINYTTGAYTVNFVIAPAATATIYAKYQGYQGNRPQGVLFFDNEFTLRPVPDQVYQIRMQGFVVPTGFTTLQGSPPVPVYTDNTTPLQQEWGPVIAYGASLDIFSDRGDNANYDRYYPIFKRFENVALSRTIQQYTAEQSVPRF